MFKRITALTVCLLVLLSAFSFSACSETAESSNSGETTTAAATDEVTSEEVETADPAYEHAVAEKDWDGKSYTVLYPSWSLYNKYLMAEEYNGATMNDAIYDRTVSVEEHLGCKLNFVTQGYIETVLPTVKTAVAAGDEAYQLALTHCYDGVSGLITGNLVRNFMTMPGIDLTKSYWNQYVVNNMKLAGALPMASGEFILADVNTIFFGTELINSYGLENPYNLVHDGKWTVDKMIEMSSAVTKDLNGDSKMSVDDQYGFATESGWQLCSFQTAADIFSITENADKALEYSIMSDKTIALTEKLAAFINDSGDTYSWAYSTAVDPNAGGTPPALFAEGRALFFCVPLSYAESFRDVELGFGILPFPKYDEAQKDYLSLNWAGYMFIPQTCGDAEFVGQVTELLQYENYHKVRPAFFDNVLDQKVAMDPESLEMLDIIFNNAVYDTGLMLNSSLFWFNTTLGQASNVASYFEKNLKAQNKILSKTQEKFAEYAAANS